jgi:hypothetical protein
MADRDKKMSPGQRFNVETVERYAFLCELLGYEGPEVADDLIGYHSASCSIYVMHDDSDKSVITVVSRRVGEATRRAELSCLYVSGGIGPAQAVKTGARNSRMVAEAVAAQAKALELVLPLLDEARGKDLMEACHGRY